jgi:hypothetical protein
MPDKTRFIIVSKIAQTMWKWCGVRIAGTTTIMVKMFMGAEHLE